MQQSAADAIKYINAIHATAGINQYRTGKDNYNHSK